MKYAWGGEICCASARIRAFKYCTWRENDNVKERYSERSEVRQLLIFLLALKLVNCFRTLTRNTLWIPKSDCMKKSTEKNVVYNMHADERAQIRFNEPRGKFGWCLILFYQQHDKVENRRIIDIVPRFLSLFGLLNDDKLPKNFKIFWRTTILTQWQRQMFANYINAQTTFCNQCFPRCFFSLFFSFCLSIVIHVSL